VLAGKTSPADGLGQLNSVWSHLSADQRGNNYS